MRSIVVRRIAIWFAFILACLTSAALAATTGVWSPGTGPDSGSAVTTVAGVTVKYTVQTTTGSYATGATLSSMAWFTNPYGAAVNGGPAIGSNPQTSSGPIQATFTFSQPVDNPVLHVSNMGTGGVQNTGIWTLTGSTATGAVSLTKIGGNSQFSVSGAAFRRSGGAISSSSDCTETTGLACGSVRLNGQGITSLTFSVDNSVAGTTDGLDFAWSFPRTTVTVKKQSVGTTGSFQFSSTNLTSGSTFTLDTGAANPATSTTYNVANHTQTITVTETIPNWVDSVTANCTNQSGATVPSSFNSGTLSVTSANYVSNSALACTFTNISKPTVRLVKATLPVDVDQSFEVTSANFIETSAAVINDGLNVQAVRTLADPAANTFLTEAGVPGWRGAGISCVATTANNGETLDNEVYSNPSLNFGRGYDYPRTIAGGTFISGNAYTCTITNNAIQVRYAKTTLPGNYNQNFVVTTTAGAPATTINATTGVSVYHVLTQPTFTRTFTETGVAGWRGVSFVCVTDTANYGETVGRRAYSNTSPGTAGGDFSSSVAFNVSPATNTLVAGNAYTCTFTNAALVLAGRVLTDNGLGGGIAHNAVADGAEAGLAGMPVFLTDCGGTVYAQASTAGDGSYSLTLLGPGDGDTVCVRRDVASSLLGVSGNPGNTGGSVATPGYDAVTFTFASNTDYNGVVLGVIERPTLELDQSATGAPGAVVLLNHQYTATTTASVSFSLANPTGAPNASSFASTLYRDADCSGTLEPSETTAVLSSANVTAGDEVCIVVRTQISSGAPDGASYDYDLEADTTLPSTSASVISLSDGDRIVVSADGTITLIKRVRNVSTSGPSGIDASASPGDVLEYTITFENPATAPVSNVSVFDAVPEHTSLTVPPGATVVDIPAGMSCQVVVPASGSSGYTGPIQWDCTGSLSPGDAGQVAFQVRIDE